MSEYNSLLDDDNLSGGSGSFSTNTMVQYAKLAYWVKFFSIITFIFLGIAVLGLLIFVIGAAAVESQAASPLRQYWVLIFAVAAIALALGVWVTSLLWSYAKALQAFVDNRDESQLELAMNKRKTFFIVSIVMTGLSILSTFGLMSAAIR